MFRFVALAIVITVSFHSAEGQQRHIDSLIRVLQNAEGVQRIDVLNGLAHSYYDYDSERGFEYASQAYDLALEAKDKPRMRRSLTLKGYY